MLSTAARSGWKEELMKQTNDRTSTESTELTSVLKRYARRLNDGGYSESTTDQYLSICRKFCDYVAREGIDPGRLEEAQPGAHRHQPAIPPAPPA